MSAKIGVLNSRRSMIDAGLKSKTSLTTFSIFSSATRSVPKVSTWIEKGSACPMAGELDLDLARIPEATMFLAAQRAPYAAERSTLVASLPERRHHHDGRSRHGCRR